jgi:hypothetical protein
MNKNLLTPFFACLVIALTVGCKENPVMIFKVTNKANKLVQDGGVPIDREEANRLISGYRDENGHVWHPLRSTDGNDLLKGFTISKGVFEHLLSQDGADGIRIYFGKDPSSDRRYYTTVLVATKRAEDRAQDMDIQDMFYEHVDPCPTHCASNDDYVQSAAKKKGK